MKNKLKITIAILKFLLLLFILAGMPLYIYFFQHQLIEQFSSVEQIEAFFAEYKAQSIYVYLILQILQIIICILPGQGLQFTAGYMYGFWMGYVWSLVGALIGTFISYYLAKILGRDAMHLFFGEEKIEDMLTKFNSKKAMILVFLFYLIPGLPKDLCSYVAGISEMRLRAFLIISLVGRSPAMMGSLLIGNFVQIGGYTWAIVIAVFAIVLFLLGVILRKTIIKCIDKIYDKLF